MRPRRVAPGDGEAEPTDSVLVVVVAINDLGARSGRPIIERLSSRSVLGWGGVQMIEVDRR